MSGRVILEGIFLFVLPATILEAVDLEVRRGETCGLVGLYGAGKSTPRVTTGEVAVGSIQRCRDRGVNRDSPETYRSDNPPRPG
jgi:ABC-type glutathione transport system ATPase component